MKMSGQRIIASGNLFELKSFQDLLDLDSNLTTTRTIFGIPKKSQLVDFLMENHLPVDQNSEQESSHRGERVHFNYGWTFAWNL